MTNQGKPNRIMLVEDNRADVYLVQQALNHQQIPYELICYGDGEEAITGLENCTVPDVILLDLNLPRLGGFEVLQAIRGNPSLVRVPVGILTTSNAKHDRHRAALIGVERYIHKPIKFREFLDEVGRAVAEMLANK